MLLDCLSPLNGLSSWENFNAKSAQIISCEHDVIDQMLEKLDHIKKKASHNLEFNRASSSLLDSFYSSKYQAYPGTRISQEDQAESRYLTYELMTSDILNFSKMVKQNGGKTRVTFLNHGFDMVSPLDGLPGQSVNLNYLHRLDGNTMHGDELMVMFELYKFAQVWNKTDVLSAVRIMEYFFGDSEIGVQGDDYFETMNIRNGVSEVVPKFMEKEFRLFGSRFSDSVIGEINNLDHAFIQKMVAPKMSGHENTEYIEWKQAFDDWRSAYDEWKTEL